MLLSRKCPKCGTDGAVVRHNSALEQMELRCCVCRYEWTAKPLDVVRQDKARQAACAEAGEKP